MKKFFTNIFLLGIIILVATGCTDSDNATNTNNDDFPSGNLYFRGGIDITGFIYKLTGPIYSYTKLIESGYSPNKLTNGDIIYYTNEGIKKSTGNYAQSSFILVKNSSLDREWNGSFRNLAVSEKYQLMAYENAISKKIFVINFKGDLVKEIDPEIKDQVYEYPEFTNDGKLLMTVSKMGVVEVDLTTWDKKTLISASSNPAQVSVSPDGTKLAVMLNSNLWISNRDGSNLLQITNDSKVRSTPEWSPDGKWIANLAKSEISFIRLSDKYEFWLERNNQAQYPGFDGVKENKLFWVNY